MTSKPANQNTEKLYRVITGKVIHGEKKGRELGFPTANILLSRNDLIHFQNEVSEQGVYLSFITTNTPLQSKNIITWAKYLQNYVPDHNTLSKGKQLGTDSEIIKLTENVNEFLNKIHKKSYPQNIGIDTQINANYLRLLTSRDTSPKEIYLYPALLHFGPRSTFKDGRVQIELHIMNFSGNLYDRKINFITWKKIRNTEKFDSIQELVTAMEQDRLKALQMVFN